jgi:NDP-sugar pyrophosphorylase family protein
MTSLAGVTVAILAGGLGTRLRPVLRDRPKALAPVAGRPFLAYILDQVAAGGASGVVLCTGHQGEQIRRAFGHSFAGLHLTYSQEGRPLGTAGALRRALPLLTSDPILVLNGDSFCEAQLTQFLHWHVESRAEATLLLTWVARAGRFGQVHLDALGRVARFEEKGAARGPGWISAGIYLIGRRLLSHLSAMEASSLEREVFPAWIGRGLHGYMSQGEFLDIGTPDAYAEAQDFFAPLGHSRPGHPPLPVAAAGAPGGGQRGGGG